MSTLTSPPNFATLSLLGAYYQAALDGRGGEVLLDRFAKHFGILRIDFGVVRFSRVFLRESGVGRIGQDKGRILRITRSKRGHLKTRYLARYSGSI